jgi:hypothetical protein
MIAINPDIQIQYSQSVSCQITSVDPWSGRQIFIGENKDHYKDTSIAASKAGRRTCGDENHVTFGRAIQFTTCVRITSSSRPLYHVPFNMSKDKIRNSQTTVARAKQSEDTAKKTVAVVPQAMARFIEQENLESTIFLTGIVQDCVLLPSLILRTD